MRKLSILADESGDFGIRAHHSPYYLLTLILHDQRKDLSEHISHLDQTMIDSGFSPHAIHTGPLIRREGYYYPYSKEDRKSIFRKINYFARVCEFSYVTFVFDKKKSGHGPELSLCMSRALKGFIEANLGFFFSYDSVAIYYDNGQRQITNLLASVFGTSLSQGLEFRPASPADYKLLQVADHICTLELLDLKRKDKTISKSESLFFNKNQRELKTILRAIRKKRFDGDASK
ncbi:MAG: DUF3800 domain-containing protein [Coriobacteriales bacterium]|jgi:hypothetical protein|nr:DUF3800 domain-containing protein [Coriobacteriales bacterium]